jgi:hypothetical protein
MYHHENHKRRAMKVGLNSKKYSRPTLFKEYPTIIPLKKNKLPSGTMRNRYLQKDIKCPCYIINELDS